MDAIERPYLAPASVLAIIREIAGAIYNLGCAERTNYLAIWIARMHGSEQNQRARPVFFLPLREVTALTGRWKNQVAASLAKLERRFIERMPVLPGATLLRLAEDDAIIRKPIQWRFTETVARTRRNIQR